MDLIKKEDYLQYNLEEKEEYIKSILDINSLSFVGRIDHNTGYKFAFIQIFYHFDPFDRLKDKYKLFSDVNPIEIKAYLPDVVNFQDGEWVNFDLVINDKEIWEIEKNRLFRSNKPISFNINKIYFSDDFFHDLSEKLYLFIKEELGPPEIIGKLDKVLNDKFLEIKNLQTNEIEEVSEKIDGLRELNRQLKNESIDLNNEISEKEIKIESLEGYIKKLEKFKLITSEDYKSDKNKNLPIELLNNLSFTNTIEKIKQQLALRNLFFDSDILRQVLTSLLINELLILVGPSGTGKTSLLFNLAEIIDANFINIPVQPSWHDKQDLLGYYNPLSKLFISTPFIDTLIEAESNPDELYIINLDEINLSKVEYYLAEILSIREFSNPEIILYSKQEYDKNIQELNIVEDYLLQSDAESNTPLIRKEFSLSDHADFISRRSNIKKFRHSIPIPDNVRIVGTMNVEGLVEPLSSKIIDRAMIVPIEYMPKSFELTEEIKMILKLEKSWWQVSNSNHKLDYPKINQQVSEDFSKVGYRISHRTYKHINKYYNKLLQVTNIGNEFDDSTRNIIIDDILIMKYLPKVHHLHTDNYINYLFNHLDNLIQEKIYPRTYDKYSRMKEKAADSKIVSFWS